MNDKEPAAILNEILEAAQAVAVKNGLTVCLSEWDYHVHERAGLFRLKVMFPAKEKS